MEPMRTVEIGGDARERGLRHGRALGQEIDRLYRRWMTDAAPLREQDAVAFAMNLLPESRNQAPELVQEVEAIAEGAGLPFEHVWFLNCFDEAAGYALYTGIQTGRACTTLGATGHSTTSGQTLLAQTWDIPDWYDNVILRIAASEDERGAVVYTHPGIVGGSGINADGICVVWNSMQPTDVRQGVPVPFLIRRALRERKLPDAIPAMLTPIRAIGFNVMIGSPDGVVNLEASARRQRATYVGRHLAHANHYEAPELLTIEGNPTYRGSSFVRSGRMAQLLNETAGHIDAATCQRLLRDHAHYPASICAHPDLPNFRHQTQAAIVYEPAARHMWISNGPPCANEFTPLHVAVERAVT